MQTDISQVNALISIIVPVYNVAEYLSDCIESLLSQTYENIEILLIDDGSTDQSPSICVDFANKDTRIRSFRKDNGGLSSARNYGIERAVGQYILFVDSDDFIPEKLCETLLSVLLKYDADVAISGTESVPPGEIVKHAEMCFTTQKCLEAILYRDGVTDISCGKLYKKDLFDSVRFTEGIKYEDFEIFFRLFSQTKAVAVTDKTSYYYRYRPGSISNNTFSEEIFSRLDIAEKIIDRIRDSYPDILPAAYARYCVEAVTVYARTPAVYKNERDRSVRIVKDYGKDVVSDSKTPEHDRTKILLFMLWPEIMRLLYFVKSRFILPLFAKVDKQKSR